MFEMTESTDRYVVRGYALFQNSWIVDEALAQGQKYEIFIFKVKIIARFVLQLVIHCW